jgi:hypothetical protein
MENNELKHLLIAYKSTVIGLQTAHDEILSLFSVSKSFYCQQGLGVGGKDCDTQCEYCKED